MTTIYLIRHAEAEGNLFRRAQGHWNGRVTERGKKQIDALEQRFKGVQIDNVYSSDLDRTVETAGALLRGRDLELIKLPELREICMGVWEGQPWGELSYRYPKEMYSFNNDIEHWSVPGSESYQSVQNRITSAINDIARKNDGGTVAVVSHGMAIKIYLMGVLGLTSKDAMMHGDNTSVSLLHITDDKTEVEYYNDNSHLGELSTFAKQQWWRDTKKEDMTSLRFEPLNMKIDTESKFYLRCYRESWISAHGSSSGFVPGVYLSSARSRSAKDPNCLLKVISGDESIGVLELDPRRGREDGCGWISLLCLLPEYRDRGLGVQLIGCAAAYFEAKGRRAIRLHVAVTNEHAIGFYEHYGFERIKIEPGVSSNQYLMERPL